MKPVLFPSIVLTCLILALTTVRAVATGGQDWPIRGQVLLGTSVTSVTGGSSLSLTVGVGDVVDEDTTVTLSSSPSSAFTNLPSSVVIPAGYSSVTITVTTATVSTTTTATITAASTNYTTGTCSLTISP